MNKYKGIGMVQRCRIMIVDDDLFIRNFMVSELEISGYCVTTAGSGLMAVNEFKLNPADIIITDIFMPDMDGFELIQSLRKLKNNLPIFVMSSGGRHGDSGHYLKSAELLGANEIFEKPVDMGFLFAKIEKYCAEHGVIQITG